MYNFFSFQLWDDDDDDDDNDDPTSAGSIVGYCFAGIFVLGFIIFLVYFYFCKN